METTFTTPKGATVRVHFDGDTLNVVANGTHQLEATKLQKNTAMGPCLVGLGVTVQVPYSAVADVEAVINAFAAHVKAKYADEVKYRNHVARIYNTD